MSSPLPTTSQVITALEQFHQRYLDQYSQQYHSLPVIEQDDDWPSPSEQGAAPDGMVYWKPVNCSEPLDFTGMETALQMTLHPDIAAFYSSFYSHNLAARCMDGDLELLQPWNRADFDRLQENLIGHIMMKRKRKQPDTVFFAVTDDDEIILSVINDTGEVWAERVGQIPHRKIADSLADFISELEPSAV